MVHLFLILILSYAVSVVAFFTTPATTNGVNRHRVQYMASNKNKCASLFNDGNVDIFLGTTGTNSVTDGVIKIPTASMNKLPYSNIIKKLQYHKVAESIIIDIIKQIDICIIERRTTCTTCFISPDIYDAIHQTFIGVSAISFDLYGAYPQANRKKIFFTENFIDIDDVNSAAAGTAGDSGTKILSIQTDIPIIFTEDPSIVDDSFHIINVEGNFLLDKATYNDYTEAIGSNIGSGVGDSTGDIIIIGDRGAHIVVDPSITAGIVGSMKMIKSVPVTVKQIAVKDIYIRPPVTKELTCVEASTRLDAIVSTAFGISRTKISKLIDAGECSVDWKPVRSAAKTLIQGNIVR